MCNFNQQKFEALISHIQVTNFEAPYNSLGGCLPDLNEASHICCGYIDPIITEYGMCYWVFMIAAFEDGASANYIPYERPVVLPTRNG